MRDINQHGGPAFPQSMVDLGPDLGIMCSSDEEMDNHAGMTLRDYFAAKSMQTTIQMIDCNINAYQAKQVAKWAYMCANAMIAEREK